MASGQNHHPAETLSVS
ncbi:hypothetical protein PBY51_021061 [Eleginops maclovinus]|uniref:Uncharacterized protein n=1 Tax=Eleginops maclovinus TaxID=56733 RepID=A0AAN8ALM7_ELEMC|nr:hypothetical protein PBY51_021061 [Eleginops maclovinus]